jgi:hypothetical protein
MLCSAEVPRRLSVDRRGRAITQKAITQKAITQKKRRRRSQAMTRQRQTGRGRVLAAGLALCAALLPAAWLPGTALAQDSAQKAPASAAGTDVLIMRKGDVRKGTILAETATTITFKSDFEGIGYTTEILKADILEIKRGAAAPAKPQNPGPAQ